MASSWACECGALNYSRLTACEVCGVVRPTGAPVPTSRAPDASPTCAGTTHGTPCRMAPTVWAEGPGRCAWHRLVAVHGERIQTPEEFERWCSMLASKSYCTLWTHASPVALWNFLTGLRSELPAASACESPSCSIQPAQASADETEQFRDRHRARGFEGLMPEVPGAGR